MRIATYSIPSALLFLLVVICGSYLLLSMSGKRNAIVQFLRTAYYFRALAISSLILAFLPPFLAITVLIGVMYPPVVLLWLGPPIVSLLYRRKVMANSFLLWALSLSNAIILVTILYVDLGVLFEGNLWPPLRM